MFSQLGFHTMFFKCSLVDFYLRLAFLEETENPIITFKCNSFYFPLLETDCSF